MLLFVCKSVMFVPNSNLSSTDCFATIRAEVINWQTTVWIQNQQSIWADGEGHLKNVLQQSPGLYETSFNLAHSITFIYLIFFFAEGISSDQTVSTGVDTIDQKRQSFKKKKTFLFTKKTLYKHDI